MKITLTEGLGVDSEKISKLSAPIVNAGHSFQFFNDKAADSEELSRRIADSDAIIIANRPLPEDVIAKAENLKFISVAFTGLDHVGLNTCAERNIPVKNCAGYSDITVAEHAVGLALSLMHRICEGDRAVRSFSPAPSLSCEISGKTVGIIGTGHIGMATAKLFSAFGAKIIAYSRTKKPEAEAMGITYTDTLGELMEKADIISLHTPNNSETKGLISRELIGRMKKSAIFINCARGPIVDNNALADALNAGSIAGAGIDVFDTEPPLSPDYPLVSAKNTVFTPHTAYASREAMVRRADIAFNNIYEFLGL